VQGLRCALLGNALRGHAAGVVQESPGGRSTSAVAGRLGFAAAASTARTAPCCRCPSGDTSDVETEKRRFDSIAFIHRVWRRTQGANPVPLIDDRVIVLPVPAVAEESTWRWSASACCAATWMLAIS